MDSSVEWQSFLPNRCFEQAAPSQPREFPTNVSSYFRQPAKVAKSNSRGNSPKNLSRRRTTPARSTKHHAASNGSISNYRAPGAGDNSMVATTRPFSWHANSVQPTAVNDWNFPYQFPNSSYSAHLPNSFATIEVNGLVTPLTQPSSAESCYREEFTPLEEMPIHSLDGTYPLLQQAGHHTFWPSQYNAALHDPANQSLMYRDSLAKERETPFANAAAPDMYTGTAPPTPDFLAVSSDAAVEGGLPPPEDEVLVGMGLYDAPSPLDFATLHGNQTVLPYRGSTGKGLKLEETFQPLNEAASEDDDGISVDEAEALEATQQFLTAATCEKSRSNEHVLRPPITTLADQSFFFEDDPNEDHLVQQAYSCHFSAPTWTDVYSGAPYKWA